MNPGTVVVGVVFALVVITVFMGVRLVPQGYEFVVQRLGKYHSTLKPGLNFIIPYVDIVAYRLTTKDIALEIGAQEAITKENAVIVANAIAFIKVIDPVKAVYGISNYDMPAEPVMTSRGPSSRDGTGPALSFPRQHQGSPQGKHLRRRTSGASRQVG